MENQVFCEVFNRSERGERLIAAYALGVYKISISASPERQGYTYKASIGDDHLNIWIAEMADRVRTQLPVNLDKNILKLQEVLHELRSLLREVQLPSLHGMATDDCALAIAFETIGLGRLAPMLLDPQIEEIYLDSEQCALYLDHADYGRCETTIQLSQVELATFVSRVALDNQFALSYTNPSMKADLVTDWFHVRVTVDITPLAVDGTHLSIRKLRQGTFTLPRLCANGTLTDWAAAFLVWAYTHFANVTIVGAPGSGKTTLQNALLSLTAPHLRVISIEDTIESHAAQHLGHLIRFKVDPFEKDVKRSSKTAEITKLLHRSPDILNLGEVTTDEHALSWFHAMSTGIPSIQTIHGSSLEYLLMRLTEIFKIPAVLLQTSIPHILVEMKAFWQNTQRRRRVTRIAEIIPPTKGVSGGQELIQMQNIFVYDPHTDRLKRHQDLAELVSFKEVTKFQPLPQESFYATLKELVEIMKSRGGETPEELNQLINNIK